jgi:hypothetical protein
MRSIQIVIFDVGCHVLEQMPLSQYQQVIQTFSTDGTDEAFADGIGFGGADRRPQDFNLGTGGNSGKMVSIFLVIVSNEIFGPLLERSRLAELLRHPSVRRMSRDAHLNDAT